MLYAALYFERLNSNCLFQTEDTYAGRVFAYFLSYYGEYFDVESQAIFFLCNNTPIIVPKLNGAPTSPYNKTLWVIDPTNSKNNMTQKTFRYEEIEDLFINTKVRITNDFADMLKSNSFENKILLF